MSLEQWLLVVVWCAICFALGWHYSGQEEDRRIFWNHLKLYVWHLRHGRIPRRWPPRLIEAGRGKKYRGDG